MNIFSGLETIVKTDCPLAPHTWFGLGGAADYFITPSTIEQLRQVAIRCSENNVPIYVLGFGSNLLVSDEGVRGAVVKLDSEGFNAIDFSSDTVTAGSGASLNELTLACVRKGLSGLEACTGIPGSVGGAIRMNAGGSFGDIGTVVQTITVMDPHGNLIERQKPELRFDYRSVNVHAPFIIKTELALSPGDPEQIMRSTQEIWIYKKNSQPLSTRNSGCIFKNPQGASAGSLIDRAGLKGRRVGGAEVSEKHANFIVAHSGCTAADIVALIDQVRSAVKNQFDVELELEVKVWGR